MTDIRMYRFEFMMYLYNCDRPIGTTHEMDIVAGKEFLIPNSFKAIH